VDWFLFFGPGIAIGSTTIPYASTGTLLGVQRFVAEARIGPLDLAGLERKLQNELDESRSFLLPRTAAGVPGITIGLTIHLSTRMQVEPLPHFPETGERLV
jgi:hypothetical protein